MPWGYGELDADDAKDGEAGDDNNDDGDKEFNKQIQKLYKELKDLQVKHAKYGVRAAQNGRFHSRTFLGFEKTETAENDDGFGVRTLLVVKMLHEHYPIVPVLSTTCDWLQESERTFGI